MCKQDLIAEHQLLRGPWRTEARACRAARRVGLVAKKTRWRAGSIDNYGGFAVIDPLINAIVYGQRFNLSSKDVIALAREWTASPGSCRTHKATGTRHTRPGKEAI